MNAIQQVNTNINEPDVIVDATCMSTRELNTKLRELVKDNAANIELRNVCGQRYIGTDLNKKVNIDIYGTPGNNLGSFMKGPQITVHGNAQDGCGNTMDDGTIIVHGHAGDVIGLSSRGGSIYIREGVGYRAGIHMKEYQGKMPVIVIGETGQDFLGEYMAGGVIILLGLNMPDENRHQANYIGTGMHGGAIFIRGTVNDYQLGKEVGVAELDASDRLILKEHTEIFCNYFGYDSDTILNSPFIKLFPLYLRPYGRLYAY